MFGIVFNEFYKADEKKLFVRLSVGRQVRQARGENLGSIAILTRRRTNCFMSGRLLIWGFVFVSII
jgi:hypothetical protein